MYPFPATHYNQVSSQGTEPTWLQRILREYKNLSKRIIVTGNDRYIHIQAMLVFDMEVKNGLDPDGFPCQFAPF